MDIFIIKITDADNVHKELLKEFQKKEISNPKTWNAHCLSYLMADRILREVYKIEDREVIFDNNKPILKNGGKHFSISHSGEYIALGFSDYNCGIDIEGVGVGVNSNRDWKAIAERMRFNSKSEEEFYKDWTKYEANYKLRDELKSIYQTQLDNYYITAVSENPEEKFELYLDIKKGA